MKDRTWVEEHNGKYVAFTNGHWVKNEHFVTDDEESLLRKLNESPYYSNIPVFYDRVTGDTKEIKKLSDKQIRKMPSSLQFKPMRKAKLRRS